MAEILTKEKLIERRVNKRSGIRSGLFFDNAESGAFGEAVVNSRGERMESTVVPASTNWENTEGYAKLWGDIESIKKKLKNQFSRRTNIASFPDDYYDLIDKIRIDITRRRMQEMDLAPEMTQEVVNAAFSKAVSLDEFRPYTGVFKKLTGANNSVPLINAKTGETGSVTMALYGLGFARTLEDELYNLDIYTLEKVNSAVTRAYVGLRNDLTVGQLVAYTSAAGWAANQQVAAATTTGASDEELMYETMNDAIETLLDLNDPQTGQEIDALGRMAVICNPTDVRRINRAINGQLSNSKGRNSNREALTDIVEIWPYRGDTSYIGEETVSYSGVTKGKAYLIVPGSAGAPAWTLTKRGLTQEVGRGDVFHLAREKRAWYMAQSEYLDEFFGETAGLTAGTGYAVEVTLPS